MPKFELNKPPKTIEPEVVINDSELIQRILDSTDLDNKLEEAMLLKRGIKPKSPMTRDKQRVSKLQGDLSDVDFEDKILRKILGTSLQKDIDGFTPLTRKDGQLIPTINPGVTRNSVGYIVSDKSKDENLLDVVLSDKMIQRQLFENIVNTEFEQLELPFEVISEVEKLETNVSELSAKIADLESTHDILTNEKSEQSIDIEVKAETINALQETIDSLTERFAGTPSEGTFFSITPKYPNKQKEDLDYWVIENGERRRIMNYAMVQLMLDQDGKSINNVQHMASSNIVKIQRGPDMTIDEITGNSNSTKEAIRNNIYIPDSVLEGGSTFKVFWEEMQGPVNNDIGFGRLMHWMWGSGQWASDVEIQDLAGTGITYGYDRELRHYLAKDALWSAAREINVDEATKIKIHKQRLKEAKDNYSQPTVSHWQRIAARLLDSDNIPGNPLGPPAAVRHTRRQVLSAIEQARQGYSVRYDYLNQSYLNALSGLLNNGNEQNPAHYAILVQANGVLES